MSIFGSIHLQHWYPNYQTSIFRSIHLQHWYPNVNIRIDPFATLVPKSPNVNIQIDPFATLVPKLPNVNVQMDPFATLVPKYQYSDRIHSQSGWLGPQFEYNHLAGAAIRTRNHNYEDRNYDLNSHPHMDIINSHIARQLVASGSNGAGHETWSFRILSGHFCSSPLG